MRSGYLLVIIPLISVVVRVQLVRAVVLTVVVAVVVWVHAVAAVIVCCSAHLLLHALSSVKLPTKMIVLERTLDVTMTVWRKHQLWL